MYNQETGNDNGYSQYQPQPNGGGYDAHNSGVNRSYQPKHPNGGPADGLTSLGAGPYANQGSHLPADPAAGGDLSTLYSSAWRPPLQSLLDNRRLSCN